MIDVSRAGWKRCSTQVSHALARAFMRLRRWVAEGASSRSPSRNPKEAGVTDKSASSEKRSMTPNTLDKEVPPLKTTWGAMAGVA